MNTRALLFVSLLVLAGCEKELSPRQRTTAPNSSQAIQLPADPSTAGQISGTVFFKGAPPKLRAIDMSADAGCQGSNSSESLLVNDGKLRNVFVYVKGTFSFTPRREPVIIEQRGCRYVPHVVGVTVGQPVEFSNVDATMHNIHGMSQANESWNISQTAQSPAMSRTFGHPELMLPVRCNQHPWMKMYINVADSPLFSVSDASGHFEVNGIPPGGYDLVFVHEALGEQVHPFTVGPRERKTIDVTFAR